MTQAGRSGCFGGYSHRITADAEIPNDIDRYKITFKQFKSDTDPIYYVLGADKKGKNGVEFGFENQLPGTDTTVNDAYLRGVFGDGVFKEGRAFHREWVEVEIQVDVRRKLVIWMMGGKLISSGYVKDQWPGGLFGVYSCYDRNSKFDDFRITVEVD